MTPTARAGHCFLSMGVLVALRVGRGPPSEFQVPDLGLRYQMSGPGSPRMPSLAVTFPAGSQGPSESTSPVQAERGEALRSHPSCALAAPWLSQSDAPSQDPKPTGSQKLGGMGAMATAAGQHSWQDRRTLRCCQGFQPVQALHCPPQESAGVDSTVRDKDSY